MNDEKLYDILLAKELGEDRWVTDENGDQRYTEEAQGILSSIYRWLNIRCCYWDIYSKTVISSEGELSNRGKGGYTPQGTEIWVLVGRYSGWEDDVHVFTSEELATEGLKLLFENEYSVYERTGLDMPFVEFLKVFCTE